MAFTVITFLCVLAASAFEVPHWVQQKSPSFNSAPVLQKIMAPFRSLQSKAQTPNSRRLQAMMSDECSAACPGVKDFIKAMMTPADPPPEDPEAAAAKMMCDNMDTLLCMGKEKACQDEEDSEGKEKQSEEDAQTEMDLFKCSCACTSEIKLLSDTKTMCENKDKVVGCLTGESSCAPLVKMMGGTRSADITCEMLDKKCEESGEKIEGCVGEKKWTTFVSDCVPAAQDQKLMDHKDDCCPLLSDVMGCHDEKCITLGWEAQELMLANEAAMKDASDEEKAEAEKAVAGNYQWGKVCTDSGLPASKEALTASTNPAAATSDAASQAAPILGMAAMLIAASF